MGRMEQDDSFLKADASQAGSGLISNDFQVEVSSSIATLLGGVAS